MSVMTPLTGESKKRVCYFFDSDIGHPSRTLRAWELRLNVDPRQLPLRKWTPYEASPYQDDPLPRHEVRIYLQLEYISFL